MQHRWTFHLTSVQARLDGILRRPVTLMDSLFGNQRVVAWRRARPGSMVMDKVAPLREALPPLEVLDFLMLIPTKLSRHRHLCISSCSAARQNRELAPILSVLVLLDHKPSNFLTLPPLRFFHYPVWTSVPFFTGYSIFETDSGTEFVFTNLDALTPGGSPPDPVLILLLHAGRDDPLSLTSG